MHNNNYQNRNNSGYTPPTSDNGFNNPNYNRPNYAAPGGSYNKKSNTGLIAAISGLSVLLVAYLFLRFYGSLVQSEVLLPLFPRHSQCPSRPNPKARQPTKHLNHNP